MENYRNIRESPQIFIFIRGDFFFRLKNGLFWPRSPAFPAKNRQKKSDKFPKSYKNGQVRESPGKMGHFFNGRKKVFFFQSFLTFSIFFCQFF